MIITSVAVAALILATLHAVGGRFRFLSYTPRSGWLSFAGGVSVAYVFVHLMPELARGARVVERRLDHLPGSESVIWLLALMGLGLFYAVEAKSRRRGTSDAAEEPSVNVYRFSVTSYAIYNALIAYLLHERAEEGAAALSMFVVAIGLHFLINDFALREGHKKRYQSTGRWILVGAIACGAVVGAFTSVSPLFIELIRGLVAGGIILNVLKEELPSEAESRLSAFVSGVVASSLLLLAL